MDDLPENIFEAVHLMYVDPDEDPYIDTVRIHRFVLEKWISQDIFTEGSSMLVEIRNEHTGITRICPIGGHHTQSRSQVFLPGWIMNNLGLEEHDFQQYIHVQPFLETLPSATKIVLKPLDTAIYHTDIRECFEKALDRYHVLEKGTMLKVCVEALGNYEVMAYVDEIEPADRVHLGGEVVVDFLQPEGGVPEFVKPASPLPLPPAPALSEIPTTNVVQEEEKPNFKEIQETVRNSWINKFKKT